MKRCEVMIPFHMKATDTDHVPGDVIEVSDEQLANIKAINVNMVLVLGEVEAKPKRSRKKVEGKGE
jgi:hypothetical protein